MKQITPAAVERALKLQDVMLRERWPTDYLVSGGRDTEAQRAADAALADRFKHEGYKGLFDRRRGTPSPKRVPLEIVEMALRLYQEQYFYFNVRHFQAKLAAEHGITLSYRWVKAELQGAGLVKARKHCGKHRKPRGGDRCRECCCHRWEPAPLVL